MMRGICPDKYEYTKSPKYHKYSDLITFFGDFK